MTNSIDSDQMPPSVASHPGLNCLLLPFYPSTWGVIDNLGPNEFFISLKINVVDPHYKCEALLMGTHNRFSWRTKTITKTRLFDPLKPPFYIVKLGFAGVYIIFLISAQKTDCGYSLEPPRRGGSNEYHNL